MPRVNQSVRGLIATITANGTVTLTDRYNTNPSQGYAIEAGGFIDVASAATVTIKDNNGLIIYGPTALSGDAHVAAQPMGVSLPLAITTTSQSGGNVVVYWTVKK